MLIILSLLTVAVQEEAPPPTATRLLDAVEAGNLDAARPLLSPDVMIMSEEGGEEASASSIDQFARFVRGCRRSELTTETDAEDPSRAAVTVTWSCPSRTGAQAFVWTDPTGVVHIQFGPAPQE
jgi:hypothetical protein